MSGDAGKTSSSSSWRSLLQSIASFRGDLSTLTAPPFILSPTSQLEYSTYWYPGKECLAPLEEEDPGKRFLKVLEWLFACMRSSYTRRNQTDGFEKKPLNPFLGELFVAKLNDDEATIVAEQVSHHPPVSAFHISSTNGKATVEGFVGIKAKFNGTVSVLQNGHTVLTYHTPKGPESYLIELPAMHIEGFLTGAPYLELDGKTRVSSTTGYAADLSFSGAGWVSGSKHTLRGVVGKVADDSKTGDIEPTLWTIKGQWNKKMTIREGKDGKDAPWADMSQSEPAAVHVRPLEDQHDLESRKAWKAVADGIRAGNNDEITAAKTELENAQREERQKEKDSGVPWQQRWFKLRSATDAASDPYVVLSTSDIQPFWRFVPEGYEEDSSPPRWTN